MTTNSEDRAILPMTARRAVYVIHEGGDTPRYTLCAPCIAATVNPEAARADAIARDDSLHCVGCDWHAPECPPECPARVGMDAFSASLGEGVPMV